MATYRAQRRDISNLCCHNYGFYGKHKNPSFSGSNWFSLYVSCRLSLTPPPLHVVPMPFSLPAPVLDCYLPTTAIDTPPAAVVGCCSSRYCVLSPRLLTASFNPRRHITHSSPSSLRFSCPATVFLCSLLPSWNTFSLLRS